MATDWDQVFKYKTQKVVKLLDRRLGLIFHSINLMVILYIVVFVMIFKKGYLQNEIAIGQVEFRLRGKTTFEFGGAQYVADAVDLIDPSIERDAIFIATRQQMISQSRGFCGNVDHTCVTDADCEKRVPISLGKCNSDGLCDELGWCPPLDAEANPHELHDRRFIAPENITLWVKAAISFPKIASHKTYTTMHDDKPIYMTDDPTKVNAYRMRDLLEAANIDPNDVRDTGCFLNVQMEWNCDVDTNEGCESPKMIVSRLDVGPVKGFYFYDALYTKDHSGRAILDTRILVRQTGYRILVASKGSGYIVSVEAIMLQLASGLALLTISRSVADGLMLFLLPERSHYRAYKEEETPDFSDLRDMVEVAEREHKQS
eukprot:c20110_g1_i1.p1 GENE.c20110_g1_i1~~c20110_g1_i1.p1  ORF type:complete len:384 (-),score=76.81 c20110_g1_i1:56-1174(-)